jgi:hypothetical protein
MNTPPDAENAALDGEAIARLKNIHADKSS